MLYVALWCEPALSSCSHSRRVMARSGNTEGTETPAKKTKERRRRTMQKGCHYILRLERYGKLNMKKLTVIAFIIGRNILQVFWRFFWGDVQNIDLPAHVHLKRRPKKVTRIQSQVSGKPSQIKSIFFFLVNQEKSPKRRVALTRGGGYSLVSQTIREKKLILRRERDCAKVSLMKWYRK